VILSLGHRRRQDSVMTSRQPRGSWGDPIEADSAFWLPDLPAPHRWYASAEVHHWSVCRMASTQPAFHAPRQQSWKTETVANTFANRREKKSAPAAQPNGTW